MFLKAFIFYANVYNNSRDDLKNQHTPTTEHEPLSSVYLGINALGSQNASFQN